MKTPYDTKPVPYRGHLIKVYKWVSGAGTSWSAMITMESDRFFANGKTVISGQRSAKRAEDMARNIIDAQETK
jgi:hypothetical protein